ncbi:MAG: ORF6N domain-containing protein [Saprospiraceae bacterium]|nr:ORF6N domain-containing protein [Saprospiraceae bacterium]
MELQIIQTKIFKLRGHLVMLDFDLAELYNVETKRMKEAVRRNMERFPADFMFEVNREEYNSLRTQIASLKMGRGKHAKYLPFAFTEHGVAMLSGVLNSQKAIETHISIIRAFIALRHYALTFEEMAAKILAHDQDLSDINEVLRWLGDENQARYTEIKALETDGNPGPEPWQNRPQIGFKK